MSDFGGSMKAIGTLIFAVLCVSVALAQNSLAQPRNEDRILAQGDPPLTETMVNKSLDLAEWALEIKLSDSQRAQIQDFFVESWRSGDRNGITEAVEIHEMLSRMPSGDKAAARQKLRDMMLQNLQRDPNGRINQIFLAARNGKQDTVADMPSPGGAQPGEVAWDLTRPAVLTDAQARTLLSSAGQLQAVRSQPLTFDEAMAKIRKMLSEKAGSETLSAFRSSPDTNTADSASAVAAGALIAELPMLAVAALLRAHELEPSNATHLANLAAVLAFIEMPQEALTIINSPAVANGNVASLFEIDGRAGVLNIRGHALLQLGRPTEAEANFRKAIEISPKFAEAKANLAFALWEQADPKKKEEGARTIGAVWRVRPGKTMFDAVERPHKPGRVDEEITIDLFDSPAAAGRLDISRGKQLYLPHLKIPTTLESSAAMYKKYQDLKIKTEEILMGFGQGKLSPSDTAEDEEKYIRESIESYGRLSPAALLAKQRQLEEIREKLELANVHQQSSVRPHWEKLKQVFRENYPNVQIPLETSTQITGSGEVGPPGVEFYAYLRRLPPGPNHNRLACSAALTAHSKWRIGINAYDQAVREYLQAAYLYMTGVAANVHDPIEHKRLEIGIREHIYTEWRNLIHYVNGFHDIALKAVGPNGWCGAAKAAGEDLDGLQAENADRCPDILKGKNKATLDFVIAKLSFNCESIGVEIAPGLGPGVPKWLTAFVEVEAKFKDGRISKFRGMTIGAGVKAGPGETSLLGTGTRTGSGVLSTATNINLPAKLSVKAGAYVKVDSEGEIVDGGLKISGSASSNNPGPITIKTSSGHEFSFAPAFRAMDSAIEGMIQ